jgi:hypothetical protein
MISVFIMIILMIWSDFFFHPCAESFLFSNELWFNVLCSRFWPFDLISLFLFVFWWTSLRFNFADDLIFFWIQQTWNQFEVLLFDILEPYGYQEVSGCPGGSWVPPGRGVQKPKV